MQTALRRATGVARLVAPAARLRARSSVACSAAKNGDYVAVHYTGTLDDGSVFDSSRERDPLEFQVGAGKVIKGFDKAVTGLEVGGKRKMRLDPTDAYGEPDERLIITVPTSGAPKDIKAGVQVQLSNGAIATVKEVTEEKLVLDLNHELAGKALTFDVELMKLTPGDRLQKATFGAGCFWGPELAFQRVPGVIATEVGYSQGTVADPSYDDVCSGQTGHTEVVQVVYDPAEVSYEALLDVFWSKHDPTTLNRQGGDVGTQYRSGIYTHTPEQADIARKSKEKAQERFKGPIVTEVEEIKMYYPAEPYHQQYLARGGRFGKAQNPAKGCNDPIRCYG